MTLSKRDFLKIVCDITYENLLSSVPKTQVEIKSMDISNLNPYDILGFLEENDIPRSAYFSTNASSEDQELETHISWIQSIPIKKDTYDRYMEGRFYTTLISHLWTEAPRFGFVILDNKISNWLKMNKVNYLDSYLRSDWDSLDHLTNVYDYVGTE